MPEEVALSPNTRHREKEAQILENTEKLSPIKTYLTLIKGFIVTGIIYYPRNVILGGWGWQMICMILSAGLASYCARLLLLTRAKVNPKNYSELG